MLIGFGFWVNVQGASPVCVQGVWDVAQAMNVRGSITGVTRRITLVTTYTLGVFKLYLLFPMKSAPNQ